MKLKPAMATLAFAWVLLNFACSSSAQPPAGRGSRGAEAADAAKQNLQSRRQSQLQQRAQSQTQNLMRDRVDFRMQARVQTQLQGQLKAKLTDRFSGRSPAEVDRVATVASRAAAELEFRGDRGNRGDRSPSNDRTQTENQGRSTRNASMQTRQAIVDANLDADGKLILDDAAFAQLPPGFERANDEALKAIFGQFDEVFSVERQTANMETPETGTLLPQRNRDGNVSLSTEPESLDSRIDQAVRQRKAQIAKLRDKAIIEGSAESLARADEWELMLEAFVEARKMRVAEGMTASAAEDSLNR